MSGAGNMIDMIKRDAANRKMRSIRRKRKRDKIFDLLSKSKRRSLAETRVFNKYSDEEMAAMKGEFRKRRVRDSIRGLALTVVTLLIGLFVVWAMTKFFF